ncbi:MAG: FG-GAP-like repeat-containing protein [Myxococcota bacterium]
MSRFSFLLLAGCAIESTLAHKGDIPEPDTGDTPPPVDTARFDTENCDTFEAVGVTAPIPDEACIAEPLVGTFSPIVEWLWDVNPVVSGYEQVMSTPVVANLTDDDGDGDIDTDDIPDIAFTAYVAGNYSSAGTLNVISGDGSGMHYSITGAGGYGVYGSGGVAIGDLEGDGSPDVCTASTSGGVLCLEADGTFKWNGGSDVDPYGFPSLADLDGDGLAEVVWGRQIISSAGVLLGTGAYGSGSNGNARTSFAVDMDDDGVLEVVAGNAVYEMDGSTVWYDGGSDGWPAVGDFDGDGLPEVVRVGGAVVTLSDTDGTLLWSVGVPGGGGGPPTVADFDGDGQPEVGVAGRSLYTVLETDGSVLWSAVTQDASSSVTGSSVFDFEGDGKAEVVYADEHDLWIYDGATGTVLMQAVDHASGTLFEYPVIADVDGDGSTEIIVGSNDMWWTGWNGITVIGDADASWAPARPIWNQHAYHITNVEDDGGIPAVQPNNWETWNNFRAGGTILGPSHWLADLTLGPPQTCLSDCVSDEDDGTVVLYLPVTNRGLVAGVDFDVTFTRSDGVPVLVETVASLDSGASLLLGPLRFNRVEWGGGVLLATVDSAGTVGECDEDDNVAALGMWPCR